MPISDIPPELPKQIQNFVTRSNELEKAEPIISYFCKLYAVEEILDKGLHTTDESISSFAMKLLDEIEAFKTSEGNVESLEIIHDQEVSIAYILSFANKIFNNSLIQIQNKTTSKSTALSLLATTQFYELLKLWKDEASRIEEDEAIPKKVKYAKFHAARILKTLKKGENPNDYEAPSLELNKSVEDEADDSRVPNPESNATNSDGFGLPSIPTTIPSSESPASLKDDEPREFKLPELPKSGPSSPPLASTRSLTPPPTLPERPKSIPKAAASPPPEQKQQKKPQRPINVAEIIESSEIYSKAQKHAKFAISAMNYEDRDTAVKQLKEAIELLEKLDV